MGDLITFGKRLKEARQKAGLTQAQLAEKSGTTAATISSYESTGTVKKASLDLAMSFAEALDVSLDWLCGLGKNSANNGYSVDFSAEEYLYSIVRVITEMSCECIEDTSLGNEATYIHIKQQPLSGFINKIKDLLKVYRNGTLSEDLFITCVDKVVSDYSGYDFMFDNFLDFVELVDAENSVYSHIEDLKNKGGISSGVYETELQPRNRKVKLFISEKTIAALEEVLNKTEN